MRADSKGGKGCTVCGHPERETIDRAVIGGVPMRAVAKQWGVSYASLQRHTTNHPSSDLVFLEPAHNLSPVDPADRHAKILEHVASCWQAVEDAKRSRSLNQLAIQHREYRQAINDLHRWQVDADLLELKRNPPAPPEFSLAELPGWRDVTVRLYYAVNAHDNKFHPPGTEINAPNNPDRVMPAIEAALLSPSTPDSNPEETT
jgi:hypothetical protein